MAAHEKQALTETSGSLTRSKANDEDPSATKKLPFKRKAVCSINHGTANDDSMFVSKLVYPAV
ncbi:hypothetical protein BHT95_19790 [Bacillus paralicheniformis]|nr:hypothetical protein BHT95_19790 [Bacillus paralicheniformis]TWM57088.1 hypothetical protein CHCC14814_4132 [Bacillus paralicheniformis]